MAESDEYVTRNSWVRTVGRPDAIDEVADQFERPRFPVADQDDEARWPSRSRGWRPAARLHPQTAGVQA